MTILGRPRLRRRAILVAVFGAAVAVTPAAMATATTRLRATTTTVSCSPQQVAVDASSSCTAMVADTASGTSVAMGGTISFTAPNGTFGPSSCPVSDTSFSCGPVSYQPSAVGAVTVTATYSGGDGTHSASKATTSVTVTARSTVTAINCKPSTVQVGHATSCTVSVSDTSAGTSTTPTGKVTVSVTTGTGTVSPSCILNSGACQVSYTPSAAGSATLTAAYSGDTLHAASGGTTQVDATQGQPNTLTALGPNINAVPSVYEGWVCIPPNVIGANGGCVVPVGSPGVDVVSARLTDAAGGGIKAETVTFNIDSAHCGGRTAITDSNGVATAEFTFGSCGGYGTAGYGMGYSVSFAGDATYAPSSASWPELP